MRSDTVHQNIMSNVLLVKNDKSNSDRTRSYKIFLSSDRMASTKIDKESTLTGEELTNVLAKSLHGALLVKLIFILSVHDSVHFIFQIRSWDPSYKNVSVHWIRLLFQIERYAI